MKDHTPAPWKRIKYAGDRRHTIYYAGKDPRVHVGAIAKTYSHSNEEGDGNLLAAAPLMHEACKLMYLYHSHMDECAECDRMGHCDGARVLRKQAFAANSAALVAAEGDEN